MVSKALHTLLHTLVDYAGLFPPAGLPMAAAVKNYAEYRGSRHAWMLGRFVVPVSRLEEFAGALVETAGSTGREHPWRLAALVGEDLVGDVKQVGAFNAAGRGAVIDAIEVKASTADAIRRAASAIPRTIKVYAEVPLAEDPRPLIDAIAASKIRAKIRTGGVTAEAIPPAAHVARFLRACYSANVAFKATAGLHHPLRSERALTYEAGGPRGTMHGFLNVFLAAALHYNGLTLRDADEILGMTSLDGFEFGDDGLAWREYRVSAAELSTVRRRFAVSFGSCSFREPVDDLIEMELLS